MQYFSQSTENLVVSSIFLYINHADKMNSYPTGIPSVANSNVV